MEHSRIGLKHPFFGALLGANQIAYFVILLANQDLPDLSDCR